MSQKLIGNFTIGHLFIALGLLSAVTTFVLFRSVLKPGPKIHVQRIEKLTEHVVVATRYINAGEVIKANDVIAINWPLDFYPRQAIYKNVDDVIKQTARIDIVASQPVYQQSIVGGLKTTPPSLEPTKIKKR